MFAWALHTGLQDVVEFHNYMRSLLKEKFRDIASEHAPHYYVERLAEFDRMNVTNTFLSVYSIFEEMLYLLWRVRARDAQPGIKGGALERYSPVLKSLGVDRGNLRCWSELADAEQVRHCLLHSNGRISMMRKPVELTNRINKYSGELSIDQDRIIMHPTFLGRIVDAVESIRDAALGRLNNSPV